MPNEPDLIKEIEERIEDCKTLGYEGLVHTLQRAREAGGE